MSIRIILSMYSIIRRLESAQMGLLSEIQCKILEQIKVQVVQYLALEELTMGTPTTFKTSIGTFKPDRQEELLMLALETPKLNHKAQVREVRNLVANNMCTNTFNSNRNKPQKWLRLTLWLTKLKNTKTETPLRTRPTKRVRISKINFAQKEVILRTLIITLLVNVSAKEHTL